MSWTRLRRWVDRVEIQLAATLLVLAAPVLAGALFLSLAYAAHEMLEERYEQVKVVTDVAARVLGESATAQLEGPLYDLIEHERVSMRILDGDRPVVARGPDARFAGRARDAAPFWDAVRTRQHDVLLLERTVGPLRLEMAASLEDFVEERGELMRGFWTSLIVGLLGSALFAVVATQRALRPLHRATQAIGAVNASQLQTRLPLRHTGDVVDQHAEALNRALDRLEKGFARILAFSSDVAHELRTPINRLLNQSGARLLAEHGDDEARTLLEVQATAEEMQEIVEGLLLLAQADEGRLRTQMRELQVARLVDDLGELYRPACEEHGVALELETHDAGVVGDEGLLVRLLSNLFDNALGHTPAGGRIVIDTAPRDGGVSIRVCDTGCGLPEADLERVFDRFVRADAAGPRRGAGLGLPIARAIARAHGGELRARNAPGGGACFDLWLPSAPER